eukprot:TRINITY_DN16346_c0_g1_i1.p1 TRINITY_DN16346_c0_g1~~TRINITY_DN16346_c0_g1_i1.p1  ORF type:complete len:108 (-),score=26.74 TRINITY_DN16346_c0_g1_i1:233-556(-)
MAEEVDEFMKRLMAGVPGVEEYQDTFLREKVTDQEAFSLLDENDLKELGIPLGIRKKLLSRVALVQTEIAEDNAVGCVIPTKDASDDEKVDNDLHSMLASFKNNLSS